MVRTQPDTRTDWDRRSDSNNPTPPPPKKKSITGLALSFFNDADLSFYKVIASHELSLLQPNTPIFSRVSNSHTFHWTFVPWNTVCPINVCPDTSHGRPLALGSFSVWFLFYNDVSAWASNFSLNCCLFSCSVGSVFFLSSFLPPASRHQTDTT